MNHFFFIIAFVTCTSFVKSPTKSESFVADFSVRSGYDTYSEGVFYTGITQVRETWHFDKNEGILTMTDCISGAKKRIPVKASFSVVGEIEFRKRWVLDAEDYGRIEIEKTAAGTIAIFYPDQMRTHKLVYQNLNTEI